MIETWDDRSLIPYAMKISRSWLPWECPFQRKISMARPGIKSGISLLVVMSS
jgi:hypothetical protein